MSNSSKRSTRPAATSHDHDAARSGKSAGLVLGALLVLGIALISGFLWIIMGGTF